MNTGLFLTLRDVLLWPPLSPLISATFLLGVLAVTSGLVKRWFGAAPTPGARACGYVVGLGVIASVVHGLAEMQVASPTFLRAIGYPCCAIGLWSMTTWGPGCGERWRAARHAWRDAAAWDRLDLALMLAVMLALALCACAPPTDADSLHYHLGVPLQILRDGGFHPAPTWLHSRLIGLGEYLNLLGLAMGSDNLGAVLAWSALAWLAVLLPSVTQNVTVKRLMLKFLLSLPALLFLVPSQKPQLIGTLALVAAVICQFAQPQSGKALLLSAAAVLFACGLKTSFYVTGGMVLLALWLRSLDAPRVPRWLLPLGAVLSYGVFGFPFHLSSALHYHNPLSPFFGHLFGDAGGDVVADFASFLGHYTEGFRFPLNLLVPDSVGGVSTALGLGVFAGALVRRSSTPARHCLLLAAATAIAVALLCQRTSRFFVEPYLLAILAVGLAQELRPAWSFLPRLLTAQLALVALLAVCGAGLLFPGTWSWSWRERVMTRSAHDYAAMQALDRTLPAQCLLFCDLRSIALSPRPCVPQDYRAYLQRGETMRLVDELAQVETLPCYVASHESPQSGGHPLQAFIGQPLIAGQFYPLGTRNPLNNIQRPLYAFAVDGPALSAWLRAPSARTAP